MSLSSRIHRLLVATAIVAGLLALPRAALAGHHSYVGVHPIAKKSGGGFCYIEGAHVHVYTPDHRATHYRQHNGAYFFVGDPVAYGYDGPKHTYYGHHPVEANVVAGPEYDGTDYCYLDGGHYHYWAPHAGASFELKGGAYWYVGAYPAEYRSGLRVHGKINTVYAGITYAEPVVVVDPPVAYVGPVVGVHAGAGVGVHAGVGVSAGVEVHAPVLQVDLGLPFVVVDGHHHGHYKHSKHKHYKHSKHRRYRRSGTRYRSGDRVRVRDGRRRHRW